MKKIILFLFLIILFNCSNEENPEENSNNSYYENLGTSPRCFEEICSFYTDNHVVTPIKAKLDKYRYNNTIYFVFTEGNFTEALSFIYDTSCNLICTYGGIDWSEYQCDSFNWETAFFIENVWVDPR